MPMKEGEIETIDGRECLRRASKVRSDLNGMAVTHASSVTIRTHLSANRKCTTQTVFSPRPTIRTLAYKNSCTSCVLRPVINGQFDRSIQIIDPEIIEPEHILVEFPSFPMYLRQNTEIFLKVTKSLTK